MFIIEFCVIVFKTYFFFAKPTVEPVLSGHSKRRLKLAFKAKFFLMQVKSIAECSKESILQYCQPSLSYHLSLRSLFCLFLSGRLSQVYCISDLDYLSYDDTYWSKMFIDAGLVPCICGD